MDAGSSIRGPVPRLIYRMGCGASKEGKQIKDEKKTEDFEGTHVAKQNVTLWTYGNGGNTAVPAPIFKGDLIEVIFRNFYLLPVEK